MLQQQPYSTLYTVQSESRLPLLEHVAFYSSILKVKIALVEEIHTRNTLTGCQLSSSSHTHPQYKKKTALALARMTLERSCMSSRCSSSSLCIQNSELWSWGILQPREGLSYVEQAVGKKSGMTNRYSKKGSDSFIHEIICNQSCGHFAIQSLANYEPG